MLLDIQGDMQALKNTKKQMEKLLNNDETLDEFLEKAKKLNKVMKEDYQDFLSKNGSDRK